MKITSKVTKVQNIADTLSVNKKTNIHLFMPLISYNDNIDCIDIAFRHDYIFKLYDSQLVSSNRY